MHLYGHQREPDVRGAEFESKGHTERADISCLATDLRQAQRRPFLHAITAWMSPHIKATPNSWHAVIVRAAFLAPCLNTALFASGTHAEMQARPRLTAATQPSPFSGAFDRYPVLGPSRMRYCHSLPEDPCERPFLCGSGSRARVCWAMISTETSQPLMPASHVLLVLEQMQLLP